MRFIKKTVGGGGYKLSKSHSKPPITHKEATSRWSSFGDKSTVLSWLLWEQYGLCCYTELRADEEKIGFHIEHVENKSQVPSRTFDYTNLGASAIESGRLPALSEVERFGGHALGKRTSVDMVLFVSCHQLDCRRYFHYLSDGRIVPADGLNQSEIDRAQYTIDVLNLDSPYLRILRREWWDEISELIAEHISNGWSLEDLAAIDLLPRGHPVVVLSRFFSISRQLYGAIGEQVLAADAPDLA